MPEIDAIFKSKLFKVDGLFVWVLNSWFNKFADKSIREIMAAKIAINRFSPKLIIAIDSCDPFPKAFELVGYENQIDYLCFPFGFYSKEIDKGTSSRLLYGATL